MTPVFDRIVIAVPDLAEACAQYQRLLGVAGVEKVTADGARAAWWGLANTVMELQQQAVDAPRIAGIVFNPPNDGNTDTSIDNALGLDLRLDDGSATADFRRTLPEHQCSEVAVDHLVLRTDDAQGCITLFRDQLGIRLALDKTVPQWGGRMLFFRAGKLTLEVIQSDKDETSGSFFWGMAYQCADIADARADLVDRGVAMSDIRDGRKPGTQVLSVKSHCLDIPTLLIEPAR